MAAARPRVLFVANPISGGGRAAQHAASLAAHIERAGARVRSMPSKPGPASQWLATALEHTDLVVVVGGDGAVGQVAPLLAGGPARLWHAAAGTENLFARSLGMRNDAIALAAAIEARRGTAVDMAIATPRDGPGAGVERPFMLMASCGFDAEVVRRLADTRRGSISHLSYVQPILATLARFTPPVLRIEIDADAVVAAPPADPSDGRSEGHRAPAEARNHELRPGGLIIANGPRYAVGIDPAPQARLDDGRLHVVRLPSAGALGALCWALRCRVGWTPQSQSTHSLRVSAASPVRWQIDGDAAEFGAVEVVEFGLRQRCVPVLLPAPDARGSHRGNGCTSLVRPDGDSIVWPYD